MDPFALTELDDACLDDNLIVGLLQGSLSELQQRQVNAHVDRCDSCRALLVSFVRQVGNSRAEVSATRPTEGRAPTSDEPYALAEGDMVDHFEVLRPLGQGGMGSVYLARDTKLDREVALKMVQPAFLGSDDAIARFLVEARATARVTHPNVVTIHAVGDHDGQPYVALERLRGSTVAEQLDSLSLAESVRVATDVAEALAATHAEGVLHRDLKASNVHIGDHGHVRVLDFGLAKIVDLDAPETNHDPSLRRAAQAVTNTLLGGTPRYMAPEQWRGDDVSDATDVWALGMLTFVMVSKRTPFVYEDLADLAAQVVSDEPVPPLPGVPPSLSELVAACLSKEPSLRPSAAAVATRLRGLARELAEPTTSLAAADTAEPGAAPRRRGPLATMAVIALVVGGIAAFVVFDALLVAHLDRAIPAAPTISVAPPAVQAPPSSAVTPSPSHMPNKAPKTQATARPPAPKPAPPAATVQPKGGDDPMSYQ